MRDVEDLLASMTLAEKASLTSGFDDWLTEAIDRVGVPAIELGDGPHGLRKETGVDMVWIQATGFPTGSALGATWDRDLVARVGVAIGEEARAQGVQLVLGPGINMKRSPLCGRNFEYMSEDPMHAGEMASAYVRGIQELGVGACVKHFAANNQETQRTRVSVEADERTLRETYLAAFERVINQATPRSIMCAYNRLGGVHASENHWLLTQVLRDDWGFDGVVVSDWDAVHHRVPALAAGLDLEMPSTGGRTDMEVVAAVESGKLDMAILDRAVARILTLVSRTYPNDVTRTGPIVDLGTAPYVPLTEQQLELMNAQAHHELAREAAAAAITLLRNENDTLPLTTPARVAIVGELARTPRIQGGGSAGVDPWRVDSPLDAVAAALGDAARSADGQARFAPGYVYRQLDHYQAGPNGRGSDEENAELARAALDVAQGCDVVIAFVGLPMSWEEEAADRTTLALPPEQEQLLAALGELDARLVVVLTNGSAITMDPWHDHADAILEAWLPGQAGAGAIADVLTGVINPSGRIAETFPLALTDTPAYINFPGGRGEVRYGEGVFIGYRWYDETSREVRYPFGHGLSYTRFDYGDAEVTVLDADAGVVHVQVPVTNVGDRTGAEIVQLYVGDPVALVPRPPRELRGFEKVTLEPGEQTTVEFTLTNRDFAFYDVVPGCWRREAGEFTINIGASSRDIRVHMSVTLPDDPTIPPTVPDSELEIREESRFIGGHKG